MLSSPEADCWTFAGENLEDVDMILSSQGGNYKILAQKDFEGDDETSKHGEEANASINTIDPTSHTPNSAPHL